MAELIADGRLRLEDPDRALLEEMLELAAQEVEAEAANQERFATWAAAMLYEAGLRAARVVVMASGYRIASERAHVTATDAADALTAGRQHRIFVRLHRMRRWRHEFMYHTAPVPGAQDLNKVRSDVQALMRVARRRLP